MKTGILIILFGLTAFARKDEYNPRDPNLLIRRDGAKIYDIEEPYQKFNSTDGAIIHSEGEIPIPQKKNKNKEKNSPYLPQ